MSSILKCSVPNRKKAVPSAFVSRHGRADVFTPRASCLIIPSAAGVRFAHIYDAGTKRHLA